MIQLPKIKLRLKYPHRGGVGCEILSKADLNNSSEMTFIRHRRIRRFSNLRCIKRIQSMKVHRFQILKNPFCCFDTQLRNIFRNSTATSVAPFWQCSQKIRNICSQVENEK